MASGVYNTWKRDQGDSTGTNWESTFTFRAMLVESTDYVFNADQTFVDDGSTSDLLSEEASGTGYTGGTLSTDRLSLATRTITADNTNDRAVLDSTDITWTAIDVGAGVEVGLAVIAEAFSSAGSADTTTLPCCYYDSTTLSNSTTPVTTNGGDLTIQWSTSGVMTLT